MTTGIGASTAVGSGLSTDAGAPGASAVRPVRTAILGTGSIARKHVQATRIVAEAVDDGREGAPPLRPQLVAAMDADPARAQSFCEQQVIPHAYGEVDALLRAEQPDLVHICTPPGPHTDLIVQCLEAGAWVLCEKPLCSGLAELDQIEAVERRTGRVCSSVFQQRYGAGAQHFKRLIASGELGRPLVALCQTTWYRDMDYYAVPWHARWDQAFGGPTMTLGIHTMDLLLWLLGDWREVFAMAGTLDRAIEVEDVSVATAQFASGALASLTNSVLSPRQETALRLDFQHATVAARYLYAHRAADWTYSLSNHPAYRPDEALVQALARWQAIPEAPPASQETQLAELLWAMARRERPAISANVRRTIEFVSALYKSAATHSPVAQGSITPGDPFYDRAYGTLPGQLDHTTQGH